MKLGLTVAGGTDAHRVSSYNPFVALQWYLDGTTIGGTQTRGAGGSPEPPAGAGNVHPQFRVHGQ